MDRGQSPTKPTINPDPSILSVKDSYFLDVKLLISSIPRFTCDKVVTFFTLIHSALSYLLVRNVFGRKAPKSFIYTRREIF